MPYIYSGAVVDLSYCFASCTHLCYDTIAEALWGETNLVLNLASKEYSKVITSFMAGYATPKRCVTCSFLEKTADKLAEKGTICKMARGEMVRFLAEEQITDLAGVCKFGVLGFAFSPEHSDENTLVFIRNAAARGTI